MPGDSIRVTIEPDKPVTVEAVSASLSAKMAAPWPPAQSAA